MGKSLLLWNLKENINWKNIKYVYTGKKIVMCVLVLVKIRGFVLHFYYPCAKLAVVCRSDVTGGQVRLQCSLNNIKINPPIIEMMSAVVSY